MITLLLAFWKRLDGKQSHFSTEKIEVKRAKEKIDCSGSGLMAMKMLRGKIGAEAAPPLSF
jgi:hypothetical protein